MPGIKVGYLSQQPELDPTKDVRGNVEDGVREAVDALAELDQLYAAYAEPDADFDALAKRQGELEDIIQARSEEHTSELQSRGYLVCRPRRGKTRRDLTCSRRQSGLN